MPTPRYLKGKKIVYKKVDLLNEGNDQSKVYSTNGKNSYVSLLATRFTKNELLKFKQKNINIKDYRFAISPNLNLQNLSKVGYKPEFNFVFSEEDLEQMLQAPKVIVTEGSFNVKDIYEKNYDIHRFYLLAPSLKDSELPVVYRLNVQIAKDGKFSVGLQAVVGGCRDGSVNLMRIDSPHEVYGQMEDYFIEKPHIHLAKPFKPNYRFETMQKQMLESGADTLLDAMKIFMDKTNLKYKMSAINESNILTLVDVLQNDKSHRVAKPINAEVLMEKIESTEVKNAEFREYVRNNKSRDINLGDFKGNKENYGKDEF